MDDGSASSLVVRLSVLLPLRKASSHVAAALLPEPPAPAEGAGGRGLAASLGNQRHHYLDPHTPSRLVEDARGCAVLPQHQSLQLTCESGGLRAQKHERRAAEIASASWPELYKHTTPSVRSPVCRYNFNGGQGPHELAQPVSAASRTSQPLQTPPC